VPRHRPFAIEIDDWARKEVDRTEAEQQSMTCEHLQQLESEIVAAGVKETFRGQAWSQNCREWVYFDCFFDRESIRRRLVLATCVHDHEHRGTHDGQEAGFVCAQCHDAIMGLHPSQVKAGAAVYR
jgi:hypothetical protein